MPGKGRPCKGAWEDLLELVVDQNWGWHLSRYYHCKKGYRMFMVLLKCCNVLKEPEGRAAKEIYIDNSMGKRSLCKQHIAKSTRARYSLELEK